MQIILMEKITNLGGLGDVVKVKDGFARNFLIPSGKARRATPANLEEFQKRRVGLEKAHAEALTVAQARGAKLDGFAVKVARKAGVDGRLFGSVTSHDIVDALKAQGHEVERTAIRLPQGPLKAIGDHQVAVALHTDMVVHVTVSVVGELVGS
jgi:large subunit ribosomal protein L9